MSFYRLTLLCMVVTLGAACVVCWSAAGWAKQASHEARAREAECLALTAKAGQREEELGKKRSGLAGMQAFLRSWEPHLRRVDQEKDVSIAMRTSLETLAQRKLSLVTDQVTVPEPGQVMFGKRAVTVQRLSMRASGESLVSLIIWLGEAEASFPLARVEAWELSATGGLGYSLKLTLAQPMQPFPPSQSLR
ncbi:MAG: hypothetical protein WC378_11010 [Opitutaceae bacterium]|jgi:hypothetical protein